MIEERLLGTARYHWFVYVKLVLSVVVMALSIFLGIGFGFVGGALLGFFGGFFLIGFFLFFMNLGYLFNRLSVYNKRITGVVGVLSKREVNILIRNVDSVEYYKSFWGRIFNFGTIVICSSRKTFRFAMVANAEEMMVLVVNAQEFVEGEMIYAQTNALVNAIMTGSASAPAPVSVSIAPSAPMSASTSAPVSAATPASSVTIESSTAPKKESSGLKGSALHKASLDMSMSSATKGKTCSFCGQIVTDEMKFCSVCGQKI